MSIQQRYIDILKSGGVVAFPTETVYGLGADAWNAGAIKKIFEVKGRPSDNPLIVHICEAEELHDFTDEIPQLAKKLIQHFWPGPLTLVFKKKPEVLDLITAGLDTVAVRMPDHPVAIDLISQAGPLVAPSANKSGRPSPTKAKHVKHDFGEDFPVIDGDFSKIGLESTVLDLTGDVPTILRPGKVGIGELEEVLQCKVKHESSNAGQSPKSPGQKYSHYKPRAEVKYGQVGTINPNVLYLVQNESQPKKDNIIHYKGNLELLSKELFDQFRQADLKGYDTVFIEDLSSFRNNDPSLYTALVNRISKALG